MRKILSCEFNLDTAFVELRLDDETLILQLAKLGRLMSGCVRPTWKQTIRNLKYLILSIHLMDIFRI